MDAATLASARDRIVDWGVRGYREAKEGPITERFVREATTTLSVPRPLNDAQSLDDVFAGVEYQRMRLRHDQRLEDWSGG